MGRQANRKVRSNIGVRGGGAGGAAAPPPPPAIFRDQGKSGNLCLKSRQFRLGMLRSNGLNYKNSLRSTSTDKTIIVETCFTFRQTNFESNL